MLAAQGILRFARLVRSLLLSRVRNTHKTKDPRQNRRAHTAVFTLPEITLRDNCTLLLMLLLSLPPPLPLIVGAAALPALGRPRRPRYCSKSVL